MVTNDNQEAMNYAGKEKDRDEIDLVDLFYTIWRDRRFILYSLLVFIVLGLIVAFSGKEEYTSRVRLLPERPQQSVSVSLAQQFGISNIPPATRDGISTRFYPDIVQSSPFLLPLLDKNLYYPEINDSVSIIDFFTNHYSDVTFIKRFFSTVKKYTIQLPFTLSGWFSKNEPAGSSSPGIRQAPVDAVEVKRPSAVINLNSRQRHAINRLRSRINVNAQDGIISLSVLMPEPKMAADLVDYVTISLIEFIENYRTEKARADVEFIEGRYNDARIRFENSQERLAKFRDENRGQLTQMARMEEQRLQSEYDLAFNVYSTLARRLEESRLNLQEETPVVKVLEPAIVPVTYSQPRREFILVVYIVLGLFTGFVVIFIKNVGRRISDSVKAKKSGK